MFTSISEALHLVSQITSRPGWTSVPSLSQISTNSNPALSPLFIYCWSFSKQKPSASIHSEPKMPSQCPRSASLTPWLLRCGREGGCQLGGRGTKGEARSGCWANHEKHPMRVESYLVPPKIPSEPLTFSINLIEKKWKVPGNVYNGVLRISVWCSQ